jgi:hydrogenase-4 transcriptional activator
VAEAGGHHRRHLVRAGEPVGPRTPRLPRPVACLGVPHAGNGGRAGVALTGDRTLKHHYGNCRLDRGGDGRDVSEATDVLRSYVRLLGRLSGAASVTLYVPSGVERERELLVHDGPLEPLPELANAQTAAELEGDAASLGGSHEDALRRPSKSTDGVLYRIPLRWVDVRTHDDAGAVERRRRDDRPVRELAAWIGLRFEHGIETQQPDSPLVFPAAPEVVSDPRFWKGFFGLGAAFVANARALSRTVFDHVTGLPDRVAFQSEVEDALIELGRTERPVLLMLLAPDDFVWVNDRLGRRSGDRVLREIGTGLRAGVRSHDHVARYGGAVFTVMLRSTSLEDGRIVAENVVRRLSDHRYHGGILRLEFSAGLAEAGVGEALDAHELIRRSDQALSAAKRGNAGSIRVWEKGSDVEHAGSVDRLQGIFTGDKYMDYRNMRLLLESVAVVASATDPAELASGFTERLFETLHARRVGVLERVRDGDFELLGGIERLGGSTQPFVVSERDQEIADRSCREGGFLAQEVAEPGDLSLCALPLFLQDRCLGAIVLEVTSLYVSFEGSGRRFLDALASEMAVALDRVRLIERERERQHEEKERLEAEVNDLRRVAHGSRLAYRSSAMELLLTTARKVARTDTTVLITGESGTGKELLAYVVHELSVRRERPVVVVDCSAIAPTLIESELFGHERGAFTGAHARKLGRLAQADRATVFLDEVGDLPLDLQSKLLRFVQQKQFTPVGGVVPRTVDARIIAATNVDLRAMVAEGRFREDLFHRLNVVRLHVPPLRERCADILHLATIFLKQFAALYRRPAQRFTDRAERALEAYAWPGNVRELQNLVLTSVLFCDRLEVDIDDLQGFQAFERSGDAVLPRPPAAKTNTRARLTLQGGDAPEGATPADASLQLRQGLNRAVAAALAAGRAGLAPIGKWLSEDLVLTADRLAGGISRRGADLLGLPETTYRRQLRAAQQRQEAGVAVRSAWWPSVAGALEGLIMARPAGTQLCQWAEACLLREIEAAAPGDARVAAGLLGVTEPTLFRRKAKPTSSRS